MAGYTQDNAASVRGVALRATRLGVDGAPMAGTLCDSYITGGFINFTFTPVSSTGDEIEVKNAAGEVCVYFKMPDTMKNVTVKLEICDPDPVLTELLVGGEVLTAAFGTPLAPPGMTAGQVAGVGYAAEQIGVQGSPVRRRDRGMGAGRRRRQGGERRSVLALHLPVRPVRPGW